MQEIANRETVPALEGMYWGLLLPSAQFFCEHNSVLKNKVPYLKEKTT